MATQASLERVEAEHPALRADLAGALAHLPPGISRDTVAIEVRNRLHDVDEIEELQSLLHKAAAGDWAPLSEAAHLYRNMISKGLALGMYFSVTCAEDAWRVSDARPAA